MDPKYLRTIAEVLAISNHSTTKLLNIQNVFKTCNSFGNDIRRSNSRL